MTERKFQFALKNLNNTHDTDPEDYEVFDLAIKALEFIEENYPKTFEDYLNGEEE